jgi:hypothetical protein
LANTGSSLFRIGIRRRAGEAELFGCPQAEQLVAACPGLEPDFLIVHELELEAFLALVETAHVMTRYGLRELFRVILVACITRRWRQGNSAAGETYALRDGPGDIM